MSSILKALKKLEEEQTIRRPETLHIDTEILRGRPARTTTRSTVLLAAILLFMCGAAATYFSMKQRDPVTPMAAQPQPIQTKVVPEAETVVVIPSPAPTPDKQPADMSRTFPETRMQPAPHQKTAIEQTLVPSSAQKSGQREVITDPAHHETKVESKPLRQAKTASAVPQLTVNGIAFQEGSSESIAVVNGISVMKGSIIEGITVADILKDRVRFTVGNEIVDVGLGKSNR